MDSDGGRRSNTFRGDAQAVTPVVGTILAVAIVVILAAVIGATSLGYTDKLGETSATAGGCDERIEFDPENVDEYADDVKASCLGISLWSFDESERSPTVPDGIGPNEGTITGPATYITGIRNTALSHDRDSYVAVLDDESLNFEADESFSITGWVNIDSPTGNIQSFVSKRDAYEDGYIFFMDSNDKLGLKFGDTSDARDVRSGSVPMNQWVHVATVVDRTDRTVSLYVDGEKLTTADVSSVSGSINPSSELRMGAGTTATDYHLDGAQDEFRIFSRALTSSEISELHSEKR